MKLLKKILFYSFLSIFILVIAIVAFIVFSIMQDNKEQKALIEDYFETHYGDTDYVIEKIFNNFPISGYVAKISSPSSPDTYFEIRYAFKDRIEDTYEEDVLSGKNTFERVQDMYNQLVNEAIAKNNVDINYSSIWGRYYSSRDNPDELFLNPEDLRLDKKYNVDDLGTKHGEIEIYAHDEEIQYETVERMMLQVKEVLDNEGIPFVNMSVTLKEPTDEEDNLIGHDKLVFYGVPYEEIEKESLLQYLKDNDDTEVYSN